MNTYILLFRGINVGGNNVLPMKELVQLLETLDCKNVKYYIQSGNIICEHGETSKTRLIARIRAAIFKHSGFEPKILILDKTEFEKALENNPFPTDQGKTLHFYFLEETPQNPNIDKIADIASSSEKFKLVDNVFYLYAPDGIGRSKLAAHVERYLNVSATARNWNTVSKLWDMCAEL